LALHAADVPSASPRRRAIGALYRELAEIGLFFFGQRLPEQVGSFPQMQFLGPGLQGAVARAGPERAQGPARVAVVFEPITGRILAAQDYSRRHLEKFISRMRISSCTVRRAKELSPVFDICMLLCWSREQSAIHSQWRFNESVPYAARPISFHDVRGAKLIRRLTLHVDKRDDLCLLPESQNRVH